MAMIGIAQSCGGTKSISTANNNSSNLVAPNTATYYDAGLLRLKNEKAKSIDAYRKAIAENPKNDAAYYFCAKILLEDGQATESIQLAKKASELQPNNKYYLELLADAYAANNNYTAAINIFKTLTEKDEKLSEKYLNMMAYMQMKGNKLEDAVQTFNTIEKYYGADDEMIYRKIMLLKSMKKHDQIVIEAEKNIAQNPSEVKYYLLKKDALDALGQTTKANEFQKQIENKFSNDPSLLPILAITAFDEKDTAKYISLLQKCIANKNMEPEEKAQVLLPYLKLAQLDTQKNIQLIQYAKEIYNANPEDSKAIELFANVLSNTQRYAPSIILYKKLLDKNKNVFSNWQALFSTYSSMEQWDSLIICTKNAMDIFPNNANVYIMNGYGQQQKQNYPAAIKSLYRALDYAGKRKDLQSQVYNSLGDVYNTQKNYTASDSSFEAAIILDPNDESALNNYAYFLSVRKEKLEKAAVMSIKSLELRKNEKTFLDTYAWILFQQKKYIEAEKIMKEALDAPGITDATLLEHYGDILSKLNNPNAKNYWLQAKEKGSKNLALPKKIATGAYEE